VGLAYREKGDQIIGLVNSCTQYLNSKKIAGIPEKTQRFLKILDVFVQRNKQ
jgi:hypothetical protein